MRPGPIWSAFTVANSPVFDTDYWKLDNISVNIVPIPAAVWLFGSALGLLGWARQRS